MITMALAGELNPLGANFRGPDVNVAKLIGGAAVERNHMTRQFRPFWDAIQRQMMVDPDWEFFQYITNPNYGKGVSALRW